MENVFVITLDRERLWLGARPLTRDRCQVPDGAGNRAGYISQKRHNAHEHADGQQNSEGKVDINSR
jgi:hypothetical protein